MIYFPKAKINIGLNIIEKRTDGYHNIESIFYPVSIHDILEINLADAFDFTTSGLTILGSNDNNLIVKAFRLMQQKYNVPNVAIHLHKQIPMGAGLGGGSSDAATTLLGLNELFNLNLPFEQLESLALELGSDCPFFIRNTPRYVTGRGEIMTPVDLDLSQYYISVINPEIHISTQEAYAGIQPQPAAFDLTCAIKRPIDQWTDEIKNDFELSVFENHPDLYKIKQNLYKSGALYAAMTGSGSTIYGIFSTPQTHSGTYSFEFNTKL